MLQPLVRKLHDWQQRRRAIRRLNHLDDRLLADIGTRREDLEQFVSCSDCH